MIEQQIPVFETNRLILRGVNQEDIPSYQKHFIDYDIIGHLSSRVPRPFPENGIQEFLEREIFPNQRKTHWLWGIFEKQNLNE
jgi:hypothetical protein